MSDTAKRGYRHSAECKCKICTKAEAGTVRKNDETPALKDGTGDLTTLSETPPPPPPEPKQPSKPTLVTEKIAKMEAENEPAKTEKVVPLEGAQGQGFFDSLLTSVNQHYGFKN